MKKLKLKRRINAGSVTHKAFTATKELERYNDKLILGNPRYKQIIEALREGCTLAEIARWFVNEGWTRVSESSFRSALSDFRIRHPEVVYDMDSEDLEKMVSAMRPNVDPLIEMNRLLRLQKQRLYIGHQNEKNLNILFDNMNDEVKVANEIIVNIAKVSGRIGGDTGGDNNNNYSPEIREELKNIRVDEASRERMKHLTNNFIKKFTDANSEKENIGNKA